MYENGQLRMSESSVQASDACFKCELQAGLESFGEEGMDGWEHFASGQA